VLHCFINPRVRKIRNESSSCPAIFSRTLRFYYIASSPGSVMLLRSHVHRKSSLYLLLGSVNLVLKVMGTPDEISSPPG